MVDIPALWDKPDAEQQETDAGEQMNMVVIGKDEEWVANQAGITKNV